MAHFLSEREVGFQQQPVGQTRNGSCLKRSFFFSEQLLNRLGRTSAKALPLPKVCLHFTGVSLHSLPSCEISARSEIPYEMYNVRLAIKACSHLAPSQRATVVLQNRSCRERREEERKVCFSKCSYSNGW